MRSGFAYFAAVVVLVGWVSALIISAAEHDWTAFTIATTLMPITLGWALGIGVTRKSKEDE